MNDPLDNKTQEATRNEANRKALPKEKPLPRYTQLELDFLDEMFERRIEDPRA